MTDHFLLRLPEWACAGILLNYGMALLQPGDSFANPNFAVMQRFASECTWGWTIEGVAALRVAALLFNGTFRWSKRWTVYARAATATLSVFVWFSLSLGIYLANVTSPGWRTYACLMLTDIVLAIIIAGQAGHVERCRHGRK